jgi:hypothetical protein
MNKEEIERRIKEHPEQNCADCDRSNGCSLYRAWRDMGADMKKQTCHCGKWEDL